MAQQYFSNFDMKFSMIVNAARLRSAPALTLAHRSLQQVARIGPACVSLTAIRPHLATFHIKQNHTLNSTAVTPSMLTIKTSSLPLTVISTIRLSHIANLKSLTPRNTFATAPVQARHRPHLLDRIARVTGYVTLGVIIVPVTLSIVFPSLLSVLIPTATALFVGAVLVLVAAVMLGLVLPLLVIVGLATAAPISIVYSNLSKMKGDGIFDRERWEIVDADSTTTMTTNIKIDMTDERTDNAIVRFYHQIGRIVEDELQRSDAYKPLRGKSVVVLRGKNVGFFGSILKAVVIPIDRDWVKRTKETDGSSIGAIVLSSSSSSSSSSKK